MSDQGERHDGDGLSRESYFGKWSQLHGHVDPSDNRLVYGWLVVMHTLARPLARAGWSPNAVTTLGLLVALLAVAACAAAGAWLWAAAILIFSAGIVDGLDGAIAVMTGKTSAWGYVWDSLADRLADVALIVCLWLLGAPVWLCVVIGVLTYSLEYTRARAVSAGMNEVGVISVWERPSRVLVVGMFVLAAATGSFGIYQPGDTQMAWSQVMAVMGAWVALLLSVIGFVQVTATVRRRTVNR
jgi:phosphatidylglycerophosphate synthase